MDGLSVLSIAASVAQFIEFGCGLVSKNKEIYKSGHGALTQNVESAAAAQRIMDLTEGLKASLDVESVSGAHPSKQQQSLQAICTGCIAMSKELLVRLNQLKVENGQKNRRWNSFRQALKSVWCKSAVDEIARRLECFKKELDGHILVSLSEEFHNLSLLQDQTFTSLDASLQQNIKILLLRLIDIHNKVDEVLTMQKSLKACATQLSVDYEAQRRKGDSMVNGFLLTNLRFPTINHREEAICETHQKTCSWIFEASPERSLHTRPWSNFVEWLQNDGNVYWVNGKAGSGKSTLMKYIYQNSNTRRHLQAWAGDAKLQIAHYYFWNSGSQDQRSHTGLMRSLLHEILNSNQDLIRQVFSAEWNEIREQFDYVNKFDKPPRWSWSFARLERAITDLEIASADKFKLCLFIDGLDEFDGDPENITEVFQRLSTSAHIKVCLSSRPWLIFEEAFNHGPNLRLENLTWGDIQDYVRDKLDANPKMQQLVKMDPSQSLTFSRTIVSKANGVFLWVKLVVASLLNGLRNRDEICDLQRRLEVIPSELDNLYNHMLGRIEPVYIQKAIQIFQIFNSATDLSLQLTALELELAVSSSFGHAMEPPGYPMSDEEIRSRSLKMRTFIKSRCEGLLETHDHMDQVWVAKVDGGPHLRKTDWASTRSNYSAKVARKLMVDWKVGYLHRTVKDYLRSKEVRAKLQRTTTEAIGFDPNLSLLQSYVVNLKKSICSLRYDADLSHERVVWSTVLDAFFFASRLHPTSTSMGVALISELNLVASYWFEKSLRPLYPEASPCNRSFVPPAAWSRGFLLLAVRTDLRSYVQKYLDDQKALFSTVGGYTWLQFPLLQCALGIPTGHPDVSMPQQEIRSSSMIELLLQYGADPNAPSTQSASETIWQMFLRSLRIEDYQSDMQRYKITACIVEAMLRSGADANVACGWRIKKSDKTRILSTIATAIKDHGH